MRRRGEFKEIHRVTVSPHHRVRNTRLTFRVEPGYLPTMRFWVGFSCGIVFGVLLGGYGAAFLFFDEYMHSPPKAVKQVPALPADQIPISAGGFAPSLGDQPLEKIMEAKEKKDQAKKGNMPPPPPPPPPSMPAEAVDPADLGE